MSVSALPNDKLWRIVMHPLAVTISIFYRIPIEKFIYTDLERMTVSCVVALILACDAVKFEPRHDKTNKVTVRPAKTQISLGIRPVWLESSLSAWRKLGSLATH